MDVIDEHSDNLTDHSNSDTQSVSSESSVVVLRRIDEQLKIQKSSIVLNGQASEHEKLVNLQNASNEQKRRRSISPKRMMTSNYSSEEGGRDNSNDNSKQKSAYEFYKKQGVDWFK